MVSIIRSDDEHHWNLWSILLEVIIIITRNDVQSVLLEMMKGITVWLMVSKLDVRGSS